MANRDYTPHTIPFANKGVSLKTDPAELPDGMYYALQNVISVQEGSLTSRFGSTRFSGSIGSTYPHTLATMRLSSADSDQYFYVGAGGTVYRINKSAPSTVTAMSPSLPAWGRWTGVTYSAGQSSKPNFFVAGTAMYKDDLSSSTFKKWGILPPPYPATATPSAGYNTPIDSGVVSHTWIGGETTTTQYIEIRGSAINLSQFTSPSTKASGNAANLYDSDDYVEINFTLSNYDSFQTFYLQFDSGDGSFSNYYYRAITLYQTPELTPADPNDINSVRNSWVMLPQSSGALNQQITLRIKKKEFARAGTAGTGTAGTSDWSTISKVRIGVLCKDVGATFTVNSCKLTGGQGPDNSTGSAARPYEYCYTYRNDNTAHESNPSVPMVSDNFATDVQRQAITVGNIAYSTDPQVTSIWVYRAGGSYTDGQFRKVGSVANVVGNGITSFLDTLSDLDISGSALMERDNDPPVLSTLPTAFAGSFTGTGSAGAATVTMSGNVSGVLTPGTTLYVLDADKSETIRVVSVESGNQVDTYFQYAHNGTIQVQCGAVVGKPCDLALTSHDSMFLAGDANNPHVLYKSKTGRPESFPVITEASGVANQIIVGSQSNPIMGLAELNGEVVCLNLRSLYVIRILNGQMQSPLQAPCSRGLLTKGAWCKGDGVIYFLSHDGIFAWAGSEEIKLSEEIDWFFKGQSVNGQLPMSMTENDLAYTNLEYYRNELRLTCTTSAAGIIAVYDTLRKRWRFETAAQEGGTVGVVAMLATNEGLYSTRVVNNSQSYIYKELTGTADNGNSFPCVIQTGWYTFASPTVEKQFGDILLEYTSPNQQITVKTFYNFSYVTDETFTVITSSTRTMLPLPIQSGNAKQARAVAFRFEFNSSASSAVSLHSMTFNFLPLAEIQRGRAGDWQDGGYPSDKRLTTAYLEYDTGGQNVTLNLDTLSGLGGTTYTANVASWTLNSTTGYRGKVALPIKGSDGEAVVCKAWRFRPTTASNDFRIFSSDCGFEKQPDDISYFTSWNDFGYGCDKIIKELLLDIDTGGVACTVELQADGATVQTFSVTTTKNDRSRQMAVTSDIANTLVIGSQFRLKLTPGLGGKAQLYNWDTERTLEPCPSTHIDSLEQFFGSVGWRYMKQAWLEYRGGAITVSIYRDGGTLFFQKSLPSHVARDAERFYLPAVGVAGALNKSKSYRLVINSTDGVTPFFLYRDSSRVETILLSAGARAAYEQHYVWSVMPLPK